LASIPKEFLLYAVHAYKEHPKMNIGYKNINGGLGIVIAMIMAQLMLITQAITSRINLNRLDFQSNLIHEIISRVT
jgi:hypothetical protein